MRRALVFVAALCACHRAPTRAPASARVVQLAVGADFACGLDDRGRVRCFGHDASGALGVPGVSRIDAYGAGHDVDVGGKVVSLVAGPRVCAILEGGKLRCWGDNQFGELGQSHRRNVSAPASEGDVDVGGPVVEVALGATHTCARLASGDVRCWGDHMPAPFPEGKTPAQLPPIPLGEPARAIAAGGWEACALLASGRVKCWGDGGLAGHDFPKMREFDPGEPLEHIVLADEGMLATTRAGHVARFKETSSGAFEKRPPLVFDGNVVAITAGGSPCLLFDDGRVRCVGASDRLGSNVGLLGVPGLAQQPIESPKGRDVDIGGRAKSVGSAWGMLSCALRDDGRVFCWGMVDMGDPVGTDTRFAGATETPLAFGPVRVFDGPDQR